MLFRHINQKKEFHFSAGITVFIVFFFILFIFLGFWQLHRYDDKKIRLSNYQHRMHMSPLTLQQISQYQNKQFLRLTVQGHYENNKIILLQNRFRHHKVGYEVIVPFKVKGENKLLLVNRGWLPKGQKINVFIKKPSTLNQQQIQGYLKYPEDSFILGDRLLNPGQWPLRVQKINIDELQQYLHTALYPFVLRSEEKQENGFIQNWKPINVIPQRHMAYAIQWFALALVLVMAYLLLSYRRKKD